MTKMRYITIQEWMLELGIGGNDLLAYALIFGFCQDGKSTFRGSLEYVANWLGCNRRTAIRVLQRLEEEGLVIKHETTINNVKVCEYTPIFSRCKNVTGSDKFTPGVVTNLHQGGDNFTPNNNSDNASKEANSGYSISTQPSKPFDLYKALLNAGVNAATAHDWLQVRKTKRLANTETGWQETLAEIRKTGYSAEYCIRTAVAQGWGGFRADWLDRLLNGNGSGSPARPRKVDNITFMLEQRERRLAEKARQQQGPSYNINDLPDEQ